MGQCLTRGGREASPPVVERRPLLVSRVSVEKSGEIEEIFNLEDVLHGDIGLQILAILTPRQRCFVACSSKQLYDIVKSFYESQTKISLRSLQYGRWRLPPQQKNSIVEDLLDHLAERGGKNARMDTCAPLLASLSLQALLRLRKLILHHSPAIHTLSIDCGGVGVKSKEELTLLLCFFPKCHNLALYCGGDDDDDVDETQEQNNSEELLCLIAKKCNLDRSAIKLVPKLNQASIFSGEALDAAVISRTRVSSLYLEQVSFFHACLLYFSDLIKN